MAFQKPTPQNSNERGTTVKKLKYVLLTVALCWGFASADQLYIHNKPFKHPTTGAGASIQAGLGDLVQAFGLKLTEVSGNFVVTDESETPALPEGATGTGKVYYAGKIIGEASDPSAMIAVSALAEATGQMVRPNKEMHIVDVSKGLARVSPEQPGKRKTPQEGYAATPKYRLIAFDADW